VRARVSEKTTVAVVFTAAVFMSALDTTIVNVALPTIGREFAVAPTAVDGISVAYLVSLALFMPVSGYLGDRFGGKRVLLAATVIFTVASALCGVAASLGELVAFRALQGVGGGMMTPVGMAMLFRAFPPGERLRASAVLVVPTTLGPASGPVLGGLLVSELSWRWVFWVNIPIGIAAVAFGAIFLRHRTEAGPGRFDLAGFLLSGAGLGLLMYGISEGPNVGWASPAILAGIVAGAILLALTVLVEYRAAEPIVAVRLLGDRLFRSGTAANILMTSGFIGTLFVMSLYLQDGRGLGALAAGLSIFPEAVGVAVGSQLASRVLYPRLGPRRHMAGGLAGIATAIGLMALLGAHSNLWWARLLMFAMGFGMAQVMLTTQTASFATVSPEATGRASTMFNAGRQLGAATGVALLTTAIGIVGATHHVSGHLVANLDAYRAAFLVAAAFCLAGVPFALLISDADAAATIPARRRPRRDRLGTPAPDRPAPLPPPGRGRQ
jgi:EmrB/QacA subfamily drug resistance transporter